MQPIFAGLRAFIACTAMLRYIAALQLLSLDYA